MEEENEGRPLKSDAHRYLESFQKVKGLLVRVRVRTSKLSWYLFLKAAWNASRFTFGPYVFSYSTCSAFAASDGK